jgi:hypothetical protein
VVKRWQHDSHEKGAFNIQDVFAQGRDMVSPSSYNLPFVRRS